MAFVAGHNTVISYDNAAGTPTDISGYIDSIGGVDLTRATLDVTAFGDGSVASILGLRGGATVSVSGSWDSALHTIMVAVDALDTGATQTLNVSPAGTAASTPYIAVETILENYQVTSSVAGKVEWSASLAMTGDVTTGSN